MRKFVAILPLLLTASLFAQKVNMPVSNAKNFYTIENAAYSLGFAESYGIPIWEMHQLKPEMLSGGISLNIEWKVDSRVKGYRITPKDIASQKMEPLQLFPKTHAMNDAVVQDSSFYTSNIIFMNKTLRDTLWERIGYSAELLAKKYGSVFIYSGPIFEKEQFKVKYTMNNHIAVPTHFYRIILYFENGKPVYKCYRLPNRIPTEYERNCDIEEYTYNLFQLEADTNIDFFDREIDANFRQDKMKFLETRVK